MPSIFPSKISSLPKVEVEEKRKKFYRSEGNVFKDLRNPEEPVRLPEPRAWGTSNWKEKKDG